MPFHWESLPPLPDAHGFAGMFGGAIPEGMRCAGGTNFSAGPMSQGGKRVWHDEVFALNPAVGWRMVGRLPAPRAYGVSGTWRDAVAVVGGNDGHRASAEGWLLRLSGDRLECDALPSLPLPMTGACGAILGDDLIVAGGQSEIDGVTALAPQTNRWRAEPSPAPALQSPSRLVAPAVVWERGWALVSGEIGPGLRTTTVENWSA